MLLDTMPGCNALAGFAAEAAGDDDRYDGAGDDEVAGAIAAWDRVEAHAAARKHAAVAEFIRQLETSALQQEPARPPTTGTARCAGAPHRPHNQKAPTPPRSPAYRPG